MRTLHNMSDWLARTLRHHIESNFVNGMRAEIREIVRPDIRQVLQERGETIEQRSELLAHLAKMEQSLNELIVLTHQATSLSAQVELMSDEEIYDKLKTFAQSADEILENFGLSFKQDIHILKASLGDLSTEEILMTDVENLEADFDGSKTYPGAIKTIKQILSELEEFQTSSG